MDTPPIRKSARLVRVSPTYKFYFAAAVLALGGCGAAPPSEQAERAAAAKQAEADARLERATEEQARAQRAAAEAQRDLQAREREALIAKEQAAAAEIARIQAEQRAQEAASVARAERTQAADIAAELNRLQSQVSDLKVQQTERGWVLTLRNDLLFDSVSASLKAGSQRALDNVAGLMRKYPDRDIAIEGFTDTTGPDEENRRISESRAEAVKRALVARGVEPSRIDTRGYGPAFPIASNETPSGRQMNRRVEIVINPS